MGELARRVRQTGFMEVRSHNRPPKEHGDLKLSGINRRSQIAKSAVWLNCFFGFIVLSLHRSQYEVVSSTT